MWVQLAYSQVAHILTHRPQENTTACGMVIWTSEHQWENEPPSGVVRCIECLDLAELDEPKEDEPEP